MKNSRIKSRTWKIHGLKLLFDRNLRFRNPTVLNAASTNIIITNAEVKYPKSPDTGGRSDGLANLICGISEVRYPCQGSWSQQFKSDEAKIQRTMT